MVFGKTFAQKQLEQKGRNYDRDARRASRSETSGPIVYLREVDSGTDNACWVVCAKGDPRATPFRAAT